MYYSQEQIDRANAVNLEEFLRRKGEVLTRSGNESRWKAHDSVTIKGNKWFRHSENKGGFPIDFLMEFYGKTFPEAMEMLIYEYGSEPNETVSNPAPEFCLPVRNVTNVNAINYLVQERGISEALVQKFIDSGDLYEDADHHNAVFIGRDPEGIPHYAHCRGTGEKFRQDVAGSDKSYGFCYRGSGERICVFEAPIDLLSFICLFPKDWQSFSYLSLGGVSPKALERFLSESQNIKTIYLCLDADDAGSEACLRIARDLISKDLEIYRMEPALKDWNEVLLHEKELTEGRFKMLKYDPVKEHTIPMIRMSDVEFTEVK